MLSVGDRVADDVLEEDLQNTARLLIDEARDTLHTTTARKAADGGLRDALDVVTENLAMALGSTLSEALSAFAASRHVE